MNLCVPLCLGGESLWLRHTRDITAVRCIAQSNYGFVLLLCSAQELHEPRRFADQNDQDAGREGIESSRMAHASLSDDLPHLCDYIMRAHAGRLVDD